MVPLKRTSLSHIHMRWVLGLYGAISRATQKLNSHRVYTLYIINIIVLLSVAIRLRLSTVHRRVLQL